MQYLLCANYNYLNDHSRHDKHGDLVDTHGDACAIVFVPSWNMTRKEELLFS